jgi:hypothetical protein
MLLPCAYLPAHPPLRDRPQKKGGRSRGRQVYLGGYETELEAARAYDRAVIAHCGIEAPLNVRQPGVGCCSSRWSVLLLFY